MRLKNKPGLHFSQPCKVLGVSLREVFASPGIQPRSQRSVLPSLYTFPAGSPSPRLYHLCWLPAAVSSSGLRNNESKSTASDDIWSHENQRFVLTRGCWVCFPPFMLALKELHLKFPLFWRGLTDQGLRLQGRKMNI